MSKLNPQPFPLNEEIHGRISKANALDASEFYRDVCANLRPDAAPSFAQFKLEFSTALLEEGPASFDTVKKSRGPDPSSSRLRIWAGPTGGDTPWLSRPQTCLICA